MFDNDVSMERDYGPKRYKHTLYHFQRLNLLMV